jgi:hypothetical protein
VSGVLAGLTRGALAGLMGTSAMTVFMAVARAAGWMRTPAPAEITSNAEARAGVREEIRGPAFTASWLFAHFGYGAAWGAAYALLRPLLPGPPVASGLLFGGALWALGYLGVMPAMGLYPPPERDDPARAVALVAAHAVYGLTTAGAAR